jgi:hypothetical protein
MEPSEMLDQNRSLAARVQERNRWKNRFPTSSSAERPHQLAKASVTTLSQHGHGCALARAGGLLFSCLDRRESSIIINLLLSLHCFLRFRDPLAP